MQDLRSLVEEQRAELEAERAALQSRATKDGSPGEKKLGGSPASASETPAPASAAISSSAPVSTVAATSPAPSMGNAALAGQDASQDGPLLHQARLHGTLPTRFHGRHEHLPFHEHDDARRWQHRHQLSAGSPTTTRSWLAVVKISFPRKTRASDSGHNPRFGVEM